MKNLISSILLFSVVLVNAQLQPVKNGVYVWNDLQVNKTNDRESRVIF